MRRSGFGGTGLAQCFAAEIRKKRVAHMHGYPQWRWHLDEVFVKVNGKLCYLWRAVDHEGEVLESVVTAKRDKAAAVKLLKRIMKKYGRPRKIVTDGLRAYSAAMREVGNADRQEVGRGHCQTKFYTAGWRFGGGVEPHCFVTNCERVRRVSTPKMAYTNLP